MSVTRSGGALLAVAALGMAGLGWSQPGRADDGDIVSRPYLFGDWNGTRSRLEDKGIHFDFGYTNEAGHNFEGGDRQISRATDQWMGGVKLDLDKLWGWHDTTFQTIITNRNGRNLDADAGLGNLQQTQELYGRGQTTWLTRMVLERSFFNQRLAIKIGRDGENGDFGYSVCDFQSLALCGSNEGNVFGRYWFNWPTSVWMTRIKYQTSKDTYVQLGVYQQNPTYIDNEWMRKSAWKINFPGGTTGLILPLEFGWTPKLNGLSGSYKLGLVFNSAGLPDLYNDVDGQPRALTGKTAQWHNQSYSGYIAVRQQLTGEDGGKGLDVSVRATTGDRRTSGPISQQMTVAFEYHSPFNRPDDIVGLGVAADKASSLQAAYQRMYNALHPHDAVPFGDSYEYVTELFYHWAPLHSLAFQPGLQYIRHVGGSTNTHDAVVVDLKTTIVF
ncbi:carbohydrate porin [Frateuria aurantia]|uniref:Carbohydrate-selective porin n=1 Tax=Frateuria aurantia (strain ATCC 33424 / DSM 6220 / KCTC 2777 / LMG 1558 / NBRC 3245 / NCIMB 13370) TaxID=767434 RepID=H8L3K3_FRAAD|nr:carbohydrate porin [Frateuria aurantia]AFC87372.1 carbohydrate-selective porin [Frateuria aurantia DSM 6220]